MNVNDMVAMMHMLDSDGDGQVTKAEYGDHSTHPLFAFSLFFVSRCTRARTRHTRAHTPAQILPLSNPHARARMHPQTHPQVTVEIERVLAVGDESNS